MDDPRLQAFWSQIDTLWLVLERPTVQRQLAAFLIIVFLAWLLPWLLRRTLRTLSERRQSLRQSGGQGLPGWQYQLVRWARAFGYTFFPLLGLLLGQLTIAFFEGNAWRSGLIQRALPVFWLLLTYRVLAGMIQAVFAPARAPKVPTSFPAACISNSNGGNFEYGVGEHLPDR